MTPEQAFATVLRDLRETSGHSQERLALESGLDRTYISLLERGLRQPSLTTILQLARALGKAPSAMVRLVETKLDESPSN